MARPEKTEPLPVCVDADVLIAGLLSRTGASHAILVLGEIGSDLVDTSDESTKISVTVKS